MGLRAGASRASLGTLAAALLAAALLAGVVVAQDAGDLEVITAVKSLVAETDAARFREKLVAAGFEPDEAFGGRESGGFEASDRDLGFGARRVATSLAGEAVFARVVALLAENGVVAVEVTFDVERTQWPALAARLLDAWDAPAELEPSGFRWRRTDAVRLLALQQQIQEASGPGIEVPDVPQELLHAWRTLFDPLAFLTFGTACGEGGEPPPGRPEIDALVAAGHFDLVRAVLRSPNPEARVFAAEALRRRLAACSEADRRLIEAVRTAPIAIESCEGCLGEHLSARELLHECHWIAVRAQAADDVARLLGLTGTAPAPWAEGWEAALGGRVFVTPPIDGWVLAISAALQTPGDAEDPDALAPWLERLAGVFPEVRYFGSNRVDGLAAWAKIVDGTFVRRVRQHYGRAGAHRNDGEPTPEEVTLELVLGESFRQSGPWPSEHDVARLAAAWSVDPYAVASRPPQAPGLVGRLPR